jgi:hypothetical protein
MKPDCLTDAEIRAIDHSVTHPEHSPSRCSYAFADAIIRAAYAKGRASVEREKLTLRRAVPNESLGDGVGYELLIGDRVAWYRHWHHSKSPSAAELVEAIAGDIATCDLFASVDVNAELSAQRQRGFEEGVESIKAELAALKAEQPSKEREAAREALTRCAEFARTYESRLASGPEIEYFRDREYPAPKPAAPKVLTCVVCGIADKGVMDSIRNGDDSHADLLTCVGALGAKVAAFAASHGEGRR